jgi:hypothetical protein
MQTPLGVASQQKNPTPLATGTLSIELPAAREVEASMSKLSIAPADVPRWQMLLGRLREEGGDLAGAAASYELAAKESWPLSGYAALGVGRVLLRKIRGGADLARQGSD